MWLVPGTMSLYSDRFQLKNAALLELYFVKLAFVCLVGTPVSSMTRFDR